MARPLLLEIQTGKHKGRKIRITDPETIIGRGDDAKIRINSKDVSRHHCMLIALSSGLIVRDLGSSNGTFVNGRPLETEVRLNQGGTLSIGPMMFQLVGDTPASENPEDVEITIQSASQLDDNLSDDDIASWLTQNSPNEGAASDTAVYDLPQTPSPAKKAEETPVEYPTAKLRKKEFKSVAEEAQDIIRRYQESQTES